MKPKYDSGVVVGGAALAGIGLASLLGFHPILGALVGIVWAVFVCKEE